MSKQRPKQAVAPEIKPLRTPLSRILWLSNDARLNQDRYDDEYVGLEAEMSEAILYWISRAEKAEKKLDEIRKALK